MLRKLMKHEFRATGRIMLPLFALLLVTALGANLSISGLMESESSLLSIIGTLLVIGFFIAMAAVCLVSFALMLRRFHKNLLQDEGYLMLTLPVSIHQHIWSKLIVSTVWFAATIAMVLLACFVMALDIRFAEAVASAFWAVMRLLARNLTAYNAVNGIAVVLEFIVMCLLASFGLCLKFYSAMSIGYSFPNRKTLMSVLVFFGMQIVLGLVEGLAVNLINDSALHYALLGWTDGISATAGLHLSMWLIIGAEVLYGAIFYILTVYFLQKRLNLE